MDKKTLTPAELYGAGADIHQPLTPERVADLVSIIAEVSAERGEARPPRLGWLKQLADGTEPEE